MSISIDPRDKYYDRAVKLVTKTRKTTISHLQRQLRITYDTAKELIEKMESNGIVSAINPNSSRDVLTDPPEPNEIITNGAKISDILTTDDFKDCGS